VALTDDSLQRRWRLLYSRLNEVELQGALDSHRDLIRCWIEARTGAAPRRRLVLRALPEQTELGPPCRLCERALTRAEELVACGACLEVAHRDCLERDPELRALVSEPTCVTEECLREQLALRPR
jgi:hypothetical protein